MSVVLACAVAFGASIGAVCAVRGERFSKFWGEWRYAHWLDAMAFTAFVLLGVWVIDDKSRGVQLIWLSCIAAGVIVGLVVKLPRSPGKEKAKKASDVAARADEPSAASSVPVVTVQPEQEEPTPWGQSWTSWFVLVGVLATVVLTIAVGPVVGAGALSVVAVVGGVLRLVLPRAAGLAARSKAFDVTVLLGLGLALAVIAAIVPQ